MKKRVLTIIISIINVIMSVLFILNIKKMDILPNKYLYIIIAIFIILNILSTLFILIKKKILNVIGFIFSLLIIIVSILGIYYSSTTNKFLDESFDNLDKEITTYNVLVKRKSNINDISLLENKTMGIMNIDSNMELVKEEVNKHVNVDFKEHEDVFDMYIKFCQNLIDSLVLDTAEMEILGDSYHSLDNNVKVIYSFEMEREIKKEEKEEHENVEASTRGDINKGSSYSIFLSGSDSRSNKLYNKTRSDVNMIITINPKTKKVLLTSIPRDYYVMFHGQTGLKDKLTHSGIYGMDMSRKTIEDLFNIDIEYTIKVGMNSVVELVDIVGGIDVNSDTEFDSYHMKGWRVKKGINHMDGARALAYARERYAYSSGDRHRIKNQQQVLTETLKKATNSKTLLLNYESILSSLSNFYLTDIPRSKISEVVKSQVDDMSSWNYISQSVDGTGTLTYCHVTPKTKLYVMVPDEKTVINAREKIKNVMEAR